MGSMTDTAAALLGGIEAKTAVVGVVGLGYVGLPVIKAFTGVGFSCLGLANSDPEIPRRLAFIQPRQQPVAIRA